MFVLVVELVTVAEECTLFAGSALSSIAFAEVVNCPNLRDPCDVLATELVPHPRRRPTGWQRAPIDDAPGGVAVEEGERHLLEGSLDRRGLS